MIIGFIPSILRSAIMINCCVHHILLTFSECSLIAATSRTCGPTPPTADFPHPYNRPWSGGWLWMASVLPSTYPVRYQSLHSSGVKSGWKIPIIPWIDGNWWALGIFHPNEAILKEGKNPCISGVLTYWPTNPHQCLVSSPWFISSYCPGYIHGVLIMSWFAHHIPSFVPIFWGCFWCPSCECSCATFQWSCLTAACELEAMAHLARKLWNHQRVTISKMGQQFWAIQAILKWMNLAFPSCLWFWHKIVATLLKAVPNDWGICAMARVPTWGNELPPYTGDTTDS